MKKSLRWLLLVIASVALVVGLAFGTSASADSTVSAVSVEQSSSIWVVECIDSDRSPEYDDGKDPWTASFITVTYSDGTVKIFFDQCGGRSYAGPDTLREMFCPEEGGSGEWVVHYSLVPGAIGCKDGRLIRAEPEPTPTPTPPTPRGEPAYVRLAIHGLVLIDGKCHEVGLLRIGTYLTETSFPEKWTEGQDGAVWWEFYPGWGNGFHSVQIWDGDLQRLRTLPITFRGEDLRAGEILDLGIYILWARCQRQ